MTDEINFKKLHDEYLTTVNDKISCIFLSGFLSGIIASYSGFIPYLTGVVSGIILAHNYLHLSYQVNNKLNLVFTNFLIYLKK